MAEDAATPERSWFALPAEEVAAALEVDPAQGLSAAEADLRQLPLRLVLAFTWVAEPDFGMLTGDEPYRTMLLEQARARLAHTHRPVHGAVGVRQAIVLR